MGSFTVQAETQTQVSNIEQLLGLSLEELEHVKVSVASQFLDLDLDAASTVELITEDEWQRNSSRRLHDAIGHSPSIIMLPNFLTGENITIRGYAQPEPTGVATLWDGVPLNTFQSGTAQFDRQSINLGTLDRIEIIRGPGSAIYGSDAFHGVLSMQSFESATDYKRVTADLGSNGYYQTSAKFSSRFVKNTRLNVSAAVSGQPDQERQYEYTDPGTGETATGERAYEYQYTTAVVKLVSEPSKRFSYNWGIYYDDNHSEGVPGFGRRFFGTDSALTDKDVNDGDSTIYMTKLALHWKFSHEISSEINTYFWDQEHIWGSTLPGDGTLKSEAIEQQYGINILFKQPKIYFNTRWSLDLGYRNLNADEGRRRRWNADGSIIDDVTPNFVGLNREILSIATDAASFFYKGKLALHYGARLDDYTDFGSQFSPRVGIIYKHEPSMAVKLLYGSAFNAPVGANLGTTVTQGDPNLDPETIDTYELVFMKQTPHWKTEVAFFRSAWNDGITTEIINDPDPREIFVNAGENSAGGIEVSSQWRPEHWQVDFSGSYVKSQNDISEDEYVAFPEYIFNLIIAYEWLAKKTTISIANRVHLNVAEGPITNSFPNPELLDDYWRTDLHIEKQMNNNWDLYLDVRNLFDRDNFIPTVNSTEGGVPDEDLSLSLGMRYAF